MLVHPQFDPVALHTGREKTFGDQSVVFGDCNSGGGAHRQPCGSPGPFHVVPAMRQTGEPALIKRIQLCHGKRDLGKRQRMNFIW